MLYREFVSRFIVGSALTAAIGFGQEVRSAVFIVNNNADAGANSLRQAVINSNMDAVPDTIIFDAVFFSVPRTITLTTGEMLITQPVTISGPVAALTISGNNASRIFNIDDNVNATAMAVSLRNMTLTLGRTIGSNRGAAVYIWNENVTFINCTLSSNISADSGGAIWIETSGGALTISRCVLDTNIAALAGGAIAVNGATDTAVTDSTFRGNRAGAGGAISQYGGGSISVLSCALHNNLSSLADAGGIFLNSLQTTTAIRNSTLSGNIAQRGGGAIAMGSVFDGTLTVQNCSIIGNKGNTGSGGAIYRDDNSTATIATTSSIFSGNTILINPGIDGPDIHTTGIVNALVCLFASNGGITTFLADPFTVAHVGVNPQVNALGSYGGPTLTHSLKGTSPAIDAGSNPMAFVNDQRGTGFPRQVDGICPSGGPQITDIGAFEIQACTCLGDVINNGAVDITDLVVVITNWGATGANQADVDNSLVVGINDLVLVITNWGPCH